MVVGEGKSFLSVLVVLNKAALKNVLKESGLTKEQQTSVEFEALLVKQVSSQMGDFPGYAKIRKVHVCDSEWSVENGLLTSTLKIKRPKIMAHYESEINALYEGHGVEKV